MGTPPSPFSTGFWGSLGENGDPICGPRAGHWYALISSGHALLKYSTGPVQDYKSMKLITETLVFSVSRPNTFTIMELNHQEYDDYEQPEFENFSHKDEQQEYNYHEEDQQQFENFNDDDQQQNDQAEDQRLHKTCNDQ